MSRKQKELILLIIFICILRYFDVLGFAAKADNFRQEVFCLVFYAVPAAILTVLFSRLYYRIKGKLGT